MSTQTKTLLRGALVAAGLFTGIAQAGYVYDGWQLDTTGAGLTSLTTNIGNLALQGGYATVTQQINGSGQPAGRFTEFGGIFSVTYIPENCPGACDFGFPQNLNNNLGLRLVFQGLEGVVTSYNAVTGQVDYLFTGLSSSGFIKLEGTQDAGSTWTSLAEFVNPKGGGGLNNFYGPVGTNGQSSLAGTVAVSNYTAGLFRDSAGNALDPLVAVGRLFMAMRTNNQISQSASTPFACDLDNNGVNETCVNVSVQSYGSANLVPEPAALSLLGAGLLGLGLARRRKAKRA